MPEGLFSFWRFEPTAGGRRAGRPQARGLRRRSASLGLVDAAPLAEGDVDLVVTALLADLPGLCSESLCAERVVCLAHDNHPAVGGSSDLQSSGRSSTAS